MSIFSTHRWLLYVLAVYAVSIIPYVLIVQDGSTDSGWVYLLMLVPGVVALVFRWIRKEGFRPIGWRLGPIRYALLALLLPLLVEGFTILLASVTGLGTYDPGFLTFDAGQVRIRGIALLFGAGPMPLWQFLPNFLLSFFVAGLMMTPLALGEELGWRGYLQQHSIQQFGVTPGMLLVGLLWGYWHLPGILMGHNFPLYPIWGGLVLMPLGTVALSLVFGYFYKASGSIWVPAFFHAALNMAADLSNNALGASRDALGVNLVWIGLWVLLAALCLRAWRSQ